MILHQQSSTKEHQCATGLSWPSLIWKSINHSNDNAPLLDETSVLGIDCDCVCCIIYHHRKYFTPCECYSTFEDTCDESTCTSSSTILYIDLCNGHIFKRQFTANSSVQSKCETVTIWPTATEEWLLRCRWYHTTGQFIFNAWRSIDHQSWSINRHYHGKCCLTSSGAISCSIRSRDVFSSSNICLIYRSLFFFGRSFLHLLVSLSLYTGQRIEITVKNASLSQHFVCRSNPLCFCLLYSITRSQFNGSH